MIRRLFTLAALLSLALCLATAVLWVRSYWYWDRWIAQAPSGAVTVWSQEGYLGLQWCSSHDPTLIRPEYMDDFHYSLEHDGKVTANLASLKDATWNPGWIGPTIRFPHWLVTFLASLSPASRWISRHRSSRFIQQGLCVRCGYDLRATPSRCPECGAMPAEAKA